MKNLTGITFIILTLLCSISSAKAQNFQWVRGGGAAAPTTYQNVAFMCTDPNGNVYALSIVAGSDPITADTFHSSFYYGVNKIILITSYNCNGQMRWAKPIGSVDGAIPYGIAADSLGNIYVGAEYPHVHGPIYIGSDTSFSGNPYLLIGLMQLDTSGHFNWIRYVGPPNPVTFPPDIQGGPLMVDANNFAHYFCYVQTGVPLIPGDTSIYGVYDMVYNTAGTLLSAVRLDLDSEWYLTGAVIDPATNKLYACGQSNMGMGAGVDTSFAAAFDASRNQLWWHYPGHGTDDDALTGISMDQSKILHFSGDGQSPTLSTTAFSFNGDSVSNTHFGFYAMSVILTSDTNGHPLWIKKFDGSTDINGLNAITQLPNGKVAATGTFAGEIIDDEGNNIVTPAGEGQNSFLVVLDSAGDLESLQQIHGDGFYDGGMAITSDRVGNVYVGGQVVDSIWAGTPPIPAFHSVGGESDFFVMKYGVDCSCTNMPVAAYTDTGDHTVGFTYSGTTSGIDSVVWNFDDGSSIVTGTTAVHTYTAAGTYRACVTVYTDCGEDLYCKNVAVLIPENVAGMALVGIHVYPNPVSDVLYVTGVQGNATYQLLSITGQSMRAGVLPTSNVISMQGFAAGVYILEVTDAAGNRNRVVVVRE